MPENFWDEDLSGGRKRVFADPELIAVQEPDAVRTIDESLKEVLVVIVVHRDGNLGV